MGGEGLATTTRFLVLALAVLYVLCAIGGAMLIDFATTRDIVLWALLLAGGAALMLAGQLFAPPGRTAAGLVSAGAVIGGVPLFWTLVIPVAVAAVIACSVALVRRQPSAPA
jgi:hypothetical protein